MSTTQGLQPLCEFPKDVITEHHDLGDISLSGAWKSWFRGLSVLYHMLSIHPSANGHWGCFHVLVFVNSAAVLYVSFWIIVLCGASPVAQMVQTSTCNVGDPSLIPGLRRSPGWGHGSPFQYSCLENPHGEKSLVGYSPWGHRVGHGWATKQTHTQGWDSWIIW